MFKSAKAFDGDISGWDVSSVTNMWLTFHHAEVFNQDISGWDVSSVTTMYQTFYAAFAFNQDISGWDVSSVTTMYMTFYAAYAFDQDLSSWLVVQVSTFAQMFQSATAFRQTLCWNDISGATTTSMFQGSGGGSARNDCTQCGAGEYRVDADLCRSCSAGSFAPPPPTGTSGGVGLSSCSLCAAGSHAASGSTVCTVCTDPSHITLIGATSEDECREACAAGSLLSPSSDGQSASCVVGGCPNWTEADDNDITCSGKCSAGAFYNGTGCKDCSPGYFQPRAGQFSCNDQCEAGAYSGGGAVACTECADEKYSLPGAKDCFYVSYFRFSTKRTSAILSVCDVTTHLGTLLLLPKS